VVVLNTCTVTAAADQDARAAIRSIHRENPDCRILVTGCYAQRAPQEIAKMPGVNWVIGNSHKHQLAEIADTPLDALTPVAGYTSPLVTPDFLSPAAGAQSFVLTGDIFAHTELMAAPVFDAVSDRTRPILKVQDGCNNRCSFCIIPSVRGRSRSLPPAEVLRQTHQLVDFGYRELVISGINLGRWGRDLRPQQRLADLVRAILEHTDLERLRISSVEPMDWTEDLISLVASSPRIAKHAHMPLQSGSDYVLRRMHRKYRPWHYADRIRRIRTLMPSAAIGADVMVGFPGETDAEFEQTRGLIAELPFTYLHVFTYSLRPGTPAADLLDQVPARMARERNRILREVAAAKKLAFQQSFMGQQLEVITLTAVDGEHTEALTDNYLKLKLQGKHRPNQWLRAQVTDVVAAELIGRLAE
jgi:threonylcarbamoyladenosine tRNA methylthiotransferase MtaB